MPRLEAVPIPVQDFTSADRKSACQHGYDLIPYTYALEELGASSLERTLEDGSWSASRRK